MRVEYISHSCFVLETSAVRITFDPWIVGSAYAGQWQLYPKPKDISKVQIADVVLISHGHEDHLHNASLKLIQKKAKIFFPFQWRDGIVGYLKYLGFNSITEAISFKTYHFKNIKITYLGYSLESVIVVECDGKVIVNINDALNSNHETAVNFLLQKIKSKWNKIDILLSGWSGAGYFPNKVHYKGKEDLEVAKIREQYFADNFCKFTKYLHPSVAIPFAPGFVLLNDSNRWINEIKFPRHVLQQYYHENFEAESNIKFPILYPGDYLENDQIHLVSEYHNLNGDAGLYFNVETEFKLEIEEANTVTMFTDRQTQDLMYELQSRINKNMELYPEEVLNDARFSILFSDIEQDAFFNVWLAEGSFQLIRGSLPHKDDRLLIKTKAALLANSLEKPWGGDLLTIGYGIDVTVFEESTLEKNLDIVCVRLISRYPSFKDDVIKHAGRLIKYYVSNPTLTNLWISQKIRLRPYVNKYPFNERDHWITFNKCDLCKVCNIPEVNFEKLQIEADRKGKF